MQSQTPRKLYYRSYNSFAPMAFDGKMFKFSELHLRTMLMLQIVILHNYPTATSARSGALLPRCGTR